MSERALLAIGCDAYDHLHPLTGAEADAKAIFDELIKPEVGDYDAGRSQLLLSPTLQEVRGSLIATLFGAGTLDALTIVFAGHGAVASGSFYMATRDTRLQGLSATSFPLAELLRLVAEAAPRQTYIFIDACQAGGLISDLNVILKSEVMGEFGTPGVTLLATAASNQEAIEAGGHGIGTAALLGCIDGSIFLQDSNPALDLVEIGRAVSEQVSAAGAQTPVVWGLNLYGPSSFCRNPHADSGNAPLRSVLVGWPDPASAAAIRASLPGLWEPYVGIPTRWDARAFLRRLEPLLAELGNDPAVLTDFARRITEAFAVQGRKSRDRFREIEVRATCVVALLHYTDDASVSEYVAWACADIGRLVEQALVGVAEGIAAYRLALVTGGMSDLYHLPIRLSKLLGWAGFAVHARRIGSQDLSPAAERLTELLIWIDENYSLSLASMSDCQAPYLMIVLTAAAALGLQDEGERLLGHLFSSAASCRGRVARADLDPSRALDYLMARGSGEASAVELVAQPTELVLTLLRTSRLFDLVDEFDVALEHLDHLALNAYLPEDYRELGAEHIFGGVNAVFQIGHDIWSVADLESAWPDFPSPGNDGAAMASLLASLLFPDRTPWFLLPVHSLIEGSSSPRASAHARRTGAARRAGQRRR